MRTLIVVWTALLALSMFSTHRAEAAPCQLGEPGMQGSQSYCGGKDPLGNGCDAGCGERGDCGGDYGQSCLGIQPGCGIITGNMKVYDGNYCQTFASGSENTTNTNDCFGKCGKGCILNCGSGAFCEIHDAAVKKYGYFHPATYPSFAGAVHQWGACWLAKPVVSAIQTAKSVGGGLLRWVGRKLKFW